MSHCTEATMQVQHRLPAAEWRMALMGWASPTPITANRLRSRPSSALIGSHALRSLRTTRALGHEAAARRPPSRHATLDRVSAASRPPPPAHRRHEPLPHLRSRDLATGALWLGSKKTPRPNANAPTRADGLRASSPSCACVRAYSQTTVISGRTVKVGSSKGDSGGLRPVCVPQATLMPDFEPPEAKRMPC
jgi:hypothetical protein